MIGQRDSVPDVASVGDAYQSRAPLVIDIKEMSVARGDVMTLCNITFSVEKGMVVGLVGPNGSGKTTLLSVLAGLIVPCSGIGTVLGASIANVRSWPRVGLLQEHPPFIEKYTGLKNLELLSEVGRKMERPGQDLAALMCRLGLNPTNRTPVGRYSAGMRKRLGIAQAIMDDPDLILLDEPTNGLDPEGVVMLRGIVRECAEKGETVIFSSHMLGEVAELCDDVYLVHGGSLTRLAAGNGGAALEREYLSMVGAEV